jgi:hypothetical protein
MKLTSVSGVKWLSLCSCYRIASEAHPRATCMPYAFHPIVGYLPSTHVSYDSDLVASFMQSYPNLTGSHKVHRQGIL